MNDFIQYVTSFFTTKPTTTIIKSSSTWNHNNNNNNNQKQSKVKTVTFLRHGCTYMNEYLSGRRDSGQRFGSTKFTDIFHTIEQQHMYHDSKLSKMGQEQCQQLGSYTVPPNFMQQCEVVLISPLTRTLQTFDYGMKPQLIKLYEQRQQHSNDNHHHQLPPMIAVPEAAERLYLISDVGRPISELEVEYPYIDFHTYFHQRYTKTDPWWYQPTNIKEYVEWRPMGQGQSYACPGESYEIFNDRMSQLYYILQDRVEQHIVVVCHHGVIDWMLDISFANCQYKQVPFTSIKPRTLLPRDQCNMKPLLNDVIAAQQQQQNVYSKEQRPSRL